MNKIKNDTLLKYEKILFRFLKYVLDFFCINISNDNILSLIQFIKFGLVGITNTFISYVTYVLFLYIFKVISLNKNIDFLVAQFISFSLGVCWSFFWNNKYVFVQESGKKRSVLLTFIRTYISYSFTGLLLSSFLLIIWVRFFNVSEYFAPIINLFISVPINFFINKYWAFKENN